MQPPGGQIAAASTDTVTVTGEFLSGVSQVALSNPRYGVPYTVPVAAAGYTSFTFVPNASLAHPAGIYRLAAQFLDAAGIVVQSTSPLPFALAPTLPTQIAGVAANAEGSLVTVSFSPNAREGQEVSLALSAITRRPRHCAVHLLCCGAAVQRQHRHPQLSVSANPSHRRLARASAGRWRDQPDRGRFVGASASLHRPDGDDMNATPAMDWAAQNQGRLVQEFAALHRRLGDEEPQPIAAPGR